MDSSTPLWMLTVGEFMALQNKKAPETKPQIPEHFGMDRLAEIIGRSKSNLYKNINNIPHGRMGGKLVFYRDDILEYMLSHKIKIKREEDF